MAALPTGSRVASLLAGLLLAAPAASALDPGKAITQYRLDAWHTKDGLPQSSVEAILQTRDGFLWLGTQEGLARFDGVRFVVFDKANTKALKHNRVTALFEDPQGDLWIGTEGGGLTRRRGDEFTTWRTADGLPNDRVRAVAADAAGNLWIGTDGGLARFDGRAFATLDVPGGAVNSLLASRDGTLWVGTREGQLLPLRRGQLDAATALPGEGPVHLLWEDADGTLWVGRVGALVRRSGGATRVFTARDGLPGRRVQALRRDRDGGLWLGTEGGGVARLEQGRFSVFASRDGLSNNLVLQVYEDREGSLWIGMQDGGLNRLADGSFTTWTTREGLAGDVVWPVFGDREGNLWIGTSNGGLSRFRDGAFTSFTTRDGLASNAVQSLAQDREGSLWVGTRGGLQRWKGGRWSSWTTKDGLPSDSVSALWPEADGNLWVGTRGGGLGVFRDGVFTAVGGAEGLAQETIHSIIADRRGTIWVATNGRGLVRIAAGGLGFYTTKEGLGADIVNTFHEDADGTLWIGTFGGGLSRLRDGRLTTYTTAQGLLDDAVFSILEDASGRLWISCNKGIYRVGKQEMDELDRGRVSSLHPVAYGTDDGMKNRECNGANQPPGWRTPDGRLWFPTIQGLVSIDPEHLREVPLAAAQIEQLVVGGAARAARDPVVLAAGTRSFEVAYTAPTFTAPGRVRFRYRLEPFDHQWVDAGPRRTAYYTNVPPGTYRFQVASGDGEGRWREDGARITLDLRPYFYQEAWFRPLGAAGLLLLAASLHRLRVRHLAARERKLAELVAVRTRELQDANQSLVRLTDSHAREETLRLLQDRVPDVEETEAPTATELGVTPGRVVTGPPPPVTFVTQVEPRLLAGRYELRKVIGRGGMGVVYGAFDRELEETVAVKVVGWTDAHSGALNRVKQEMKLARRVTHPNVVRTYEFGEVEEASYISMEYVQGETLRDLVRRTGGLPLGVGLRIAKQICLGLEAAHRQGVIHRDVKSGNILVERDTGEVKITDFGVARVSALDGDAPSDLIVGTPAYLSPEQAARQATTFASDVYSTGVVFFEMFTGRLPFVGSSASELVRQHIDTPPPSPRALAADLPELVEDVILRCLEKNPTRRYPEASDLLAELTEVSWAVTSRMRQAGSAG